MRAEYKFVGASLFVLATSVAPHASAGTRAPMSSIAALPKAAPIAVPAEPVEIPGVVVSTKAIRGAQRYHQIEAAKSGGYCLAFSDQPHFMTTWTVGATEPAADADLDRLVVQKDGRVTLERTRLHMDPHDVSSLRAIARSSVELHEIARTAKGVVVWAYREGTDVVVIARDVDGGTDARSGVHDSVTAFIQNDGCSFAAMHIDARKPEGGAFGQLVGTLPRQGKAKGTPDVRFVIDASVSRVTRDPEPMLAVRVRTLE
jgi:hypothetical protein